ALGRVGTGRALARLDAQTQGLLVDADLKKAARTAAEAIRARGGEGLRGGLALVDAAGAEGGLTLSDSEEPER
ncbi:MAG: hypothetical protein KC620_18665, partial [Myxococcales bacterium]|nr:hypothetical protein [Myxococcales bacterium]